MAWLDETGPKPTAHYLCANPQCPNYREEFGEEVKAFLEQLVVVVQVMPEERIAFGKRPAPEDRLAGSVPYLRMLSVATCGWLMARQATAVPLMRSEAV